MIGCRSELRSPFAQKLGMKNNLALEVKDTRLAPINESSGSSAVHIDPEGELISHPAKCTDLMRKNVEEVLCHRKNVKSSIYVDINKPDSKDGCSDRRKGTETLDASEAQIVQLGENEPQLDRECLKVWYKTITTGTGEALCSAKEGQRALSDHKRKSVVNSIDLTAISPKREETFCQLLGQSHEKEFAVVGEYMNVYHDNPEKNFSSHGPNSSLVCISSDSESESGMHHRHQKHKAKRKCKELYSPHMKSSVRALKPKSARLYFAKRSEEFLGSLSEVSETNLTGNFQEKSCSAHNNFSVELSQLESDEMLARQLQEQFDHELQDFESTEKTSESIAWSLQQGEARYAASTWPNQTHSRDASLEQLSIHNLQPSFESYSQQLSNLTWVSSSRRMGQPMRNFSGPEIDQRMSIIAEVSRNFSNGKMDHEMRCKMFNALDAVLDHTEDTESLDEIYEDDYLMLPTFCDDTYLHSGASESQINSLPEFVVQSIINIEACAICLEPPVVGEVVRHLRCAHKFHKQCIDTWLRKRMLCPVCKLSIS